MTEPCGLAQLTVGQSGARITRLGFGAGGAWASHMVPLSEAIRLVHRALDLGIAYFDTGPTYGRGDAERRLATALSGRDGVAVSTKVGTHAGPGRGLTKDYSARGLRESLEASLRRLNRSSVDLLYVHGPLEVSHLTDELIAAMVEFRDEGLAVAIGASCDGDVAGAVVTSGAFDALMITVNVLTPSAYPVAERATAQGMTVVAKSPLGHAVTSWSRLLPRDRRKAWYVARLLRHYPFDLWNGLRMGRVLASGPGRNATATSLQFLMAQRFVGAAVVGTTRGNHLDELVEAISIAPLERLMVEQIEARQRSVIRGR